MIENTNLLIKIEKLVDYYNQGKLGGSFMPEDKNPGLLKSSKENYLYFTLPMALNYQRNSYTLWESVYQSYMDEETKNIFNVYKVNDMNIDELRALLLKYKIALQPNKQPLIWQTLSQTILELFDGDIRNLFIENDYSVRKIKEFILDNKKRFPYLSGNKIMNYWLYVMQNYTDLQFIDRENITIAPDTHVIQASLFLGIITKAEENDSNIQDIVATRWKELLKDTKYQPIDLHTPLWLWSREKFSIEI